MEYNFVIKKYIYIRPLLNWTEQLKIVEQLTI